eukprot:TRINITY_DN5435_c0_g1_i1.p1 TRINITY_DN5435_c0_g1~~TRINITY_DN5435_c0_g1_i1.p1  ORF type:complete len:417 (+),score=118.78 TRINITY_DN5435_c0_g1_i1:180-1253(+)
MNEQDHFSKIIRSFIFYPKYMSMWIDRLEDSFHHIPEKHQKLVPDFERRIQNMRTAASINTDFVSNIVQSHQIFENVETTVDLEQLNTQAFNVGHEGFHAQGYDMDKVKSTLRQFMRDWSEEGKTERDQCYKPILDELSAKFPEISERAKIRVLTPGAGLGRLTFEIARLGFSSQGNEYSYFMLLASNFILNRCQREKQFKLFPYLHASSNVVHNGDPFRLVHIPDIAPAKNLPPNIEFSMAAGDFTEIYRNQKGEWDVVVTCFFIDTAKNIVEYIELLSEMIKPGGVWINLGPLLYHWAEIPGEFSVDLTYEQLRGVIKTWFRFEKEESRVSSYVGDNLSMMRVLYNCPFFVAIRE